MTPTAAPISGNQIAVTLASANLTGSDYVLVTPTDRAHQSATDSFGNTRILFMEDEAGGAIGGSGDTQIDLSGLSGSFFLYDPDGGNDTLTGNGDDNDLEGGLDNDTLIGNAGDDELSGGKGADTMDGSAGADQFRFEQGDSTLVSFNNGVYTFTGGADVVSGTGFTVVPNNNNSESGDHISLRSPISDNGVSVMTNAPVDGLATDQGYYLARGNFSGGVFTTHVGGADTLVVYDGNSAVGAVSQTALVLTGINPTQLTTTSWGDIYLASGPDIAPPLIQSAVVIGSSLTLIYNEALGTAPLPTAFQVNVNGSPVAVNSTAVFDNSVSLTLVSAVANGDTVTVSYTDPSVNDDFNAIQDVAGNDAAGLSNLAVVNNTQSGSGDTTPPTSTGATFINSANSVITLSYSEAVTASSPAGLSMSLNPMDENGWSGATISVNGTPTGLGTATIGLPTSATLGAGDVVRLRYDAGQGDLRDLSNIPVPSAEIFFGGSGDNTIDLDDYWSDLPITLRGNGANDTLIGTDRNDVLIDGNGVDVLSGGMGADRFVLVENGTIPFSRDVVKIALGESNISYLDYIISSATSPTTSGFDIASTTAANHDALDLPSNVIAANAANIDGIDAGGISRHSVANGIVTFLDASSTPKLAGSLQNALDYLSANFTAPGVTVAFKADIDSNGVVDSLYVFQDNGTATLAGGFMPPDTLVRLQNLIGIDNATLGTTAGANVVQIQDTQAPEPIGMALTSDGMSFNFSESTFTPANVADLALTMQKNGAGTVFSPSSVDGNGTPNMTLHYAGVTLAPEDWAMMHYAGSGTNNALRDTANNALIEEAGGFGFAEGGSGNNTINLSALNAEHDLNGNAGNDTLIGSQGNDWITGGTGADTMTGGSGSDEFSFEQGDSPAVSGMNLGGDSTLNTGDTFSFANGVDRVTDLSDSEAVELNKPMSELLGNWEGMFYMGSTPTNGLANDQGYYAVQGNFSGGIFTVNTTSGSDTLLVYDGDSSSGVSQTGIVLSGVQAGQLQLGGSWIQVYSTSGFSNADDTYTLPAPDVIGQMVDAQGGTDTIELAFYPTMIVPDGLGLHFGEDLDPDSISSDMIVYSLDNQSETSYHLSGMHDVLAPQPVTDYDLTLNNFERLRFDDGTDVLDIDLANDIGWIQANQAVSGVLDGNTLAANYLFASYEAGAGVSQVIGGAVLADTAGVFFDIVSGEIQMVKDESVPADPVWRFMEGANQVFNLTQIGNAWAVDYAFDGAGTDVTLSNIEYLTVLNNLDDSVLLRLSFTSSEPLVIA